MTATVVPAAASSAAATRNAERAPAARPVVAATTGRTNLLATILSPDTQSLHHYLTVRLATTAITAIETAPILRTLKAVAPQLPSPAYP